MSTYEEKLRRQQHFLRRTEMLISEVNREIIGPKIPEITEETVIQMARSVAHLRGRYLKAAFRLSEKGDNVRADDPDVAELRDLRNIYKETRMAFEELTHALERGYIDLQEDT